ncbi:MAG: hypothetical protein ACRDQA_02825 [Nocardioidaceae bacterium]
MASLTERLAEALSTCICEPFPFGDGPEIDCPMHGRADYQAAALLPVVAEAQAEVAEQIAWAIEATRDEGNWGDHASFTLAARIARKAGAR